MHRDLAVRNVLLTTSRGRFSSLAGAQLILSSDGPTDVRSAGSDRPPIRWSAPEALRLYLNGDESTGAFFEASLSLDWTVVPAPVQRRCSVRAQCRGAPATVTSSARASIPARDAPYVGA